MIEAERWLAAARRRPAADPPETGRLAAGPVLSFPHRAGFEAAVVRIVERIARGEIYQVNLCRRLEALLPAESLWPLYRRLRAASPADHGAYLDLGEGRALLSVSPELYLSLRGGAAETRPIKGTRPRGANPRADRALSRELLESEKDRAELTMIVDVARNDLGRVCETGSVEVSDHAALVSLPTLHHTVSTVRGRLAAGASPVDLLRASFPPASITGAPKIRAMAVIAAEEERARGPAMGAFGWLSLAGDLESRRRHPHRGLGGRPGRLPRRLRHRRRLRPGAGARGERGQGEGLPHRSRSAGSMTRTFWDGRLVAAESVRLDPADAGFLLGDGLFETLRVDGGAAGDIEAHLDRLLAGLARVAISIPEDREALARAVAAVAETAPRPTARLRITISRGVEDRPTRLITAIPYAPPLEETYRNGVAALLLAEPWIDSRSPLAGLKSLSWQANRLAGLRAEAAGAFEALLVNERGKLVEGSRSNLAVVLGGQALTPPLSDGALPGTTRRRLLEAGELAERSLSPDALAEADEILLMNSLIGVLRVTRIDGRNVSAGPVAARLRDASRAK